jgi:hypothetical protein
VIPGGRKRGVDIPPALDLGSGDGGKDFRVDYDIYMYIYM